jgi:23S rRNA (pseudouridine1915-N3)-methyltransferase
MRSVRIIAVGRIKQSAKYLVEGIELYQKRLSRHIDIQWIEVPDEAPTSTRPVEQVREREAEAILKQCGPDDHVILLNERGKHMNSETFAEWLFNGNPPNGGRPQLGGDRMIFIIGGAFGTSEKLEERASETISLSQLTFPHQMVRLILIEQLYRAFTIAHHEPYHK